MIIRSNSKKIKILESLELMSAFVPEAAIAFKNQIAHIERTDFASNEALKKYMIETENVFERHFEAGFSLASEAEYLQGVIYSAYRLPE